MKKNDTTPAHTPEDEIEQLPGSIRNKRARIVVQHILEHEYITTEELEKNYGYAHPPRAARDVREADIPLETYRVKSSDGRSIAAYRFRNLNKIRRNRLQGRKTFPKRLKRTLYAISNGKCAICSGSFQPHYLQIDHRIPYEVAGDINTEWHTDDYMLLCGSCNRAKSWSCEHCQNWQNPKSQSLCLTCYWATPENYEHIALRKTRRVAVVWGHEEIQDYEQLKKEAEKATFSVSDYSKKFSTNT